MRHFTNHRLAAAVALGGVLFVFASHPAAADLVAGPNGSLVDTFDSYKGGTQNVPTGAPGSSTANANYYDLFYSSSPSQNTNVAAHSDEGIVSSTSQYYGTAGNYTIPGGSAHGYYSSAPQTLNGGNSLQFFTQLTSSTTTFGSYNNGVNAPTSGIGFQRITSRATNATANANQGQEDGYATVDLGGTVSFYMYVDAGIPSLTATGGSYGTALAAGTAPMAVELGISETSGGATLGSGGTGTGSPNLFEDYGVGGVANGASTTGSYPTGGIYVTNGSWQKVTFNLAADTQSYVLGTTNVPTRSGLGYLYDMGFTALSTPGLAAATANPTYSIYIADFVITPSASATAPEPSSWAFLGTGLCLAGIGGRQMLRKRPATRSVPRVA